MNLTINYNECNDNNEDVLLEKGMTLRGVDSIL